MISARKLRTEMLDQDISVHEMSRRTGKKVSEIAEYCREGVKKDHDAHAIGQILGIKIW